LVIALAQDLALPAWWLVAPAAFSVELAVLFPAQAASHLVSYATGHFTGRDMAKTGVFLSAAAVFVIAAVALLLGR
jgi:di/tricarboxylate transporter